MLLFMLLSTLALQGQRYIQMKCIWAYYSSNDDSYIISEKLGDTLAILIHKNDLFYYTDINNKHLRGKSENHLDSKWKEIDYWLFYTTCSFNDDFTQMVYRVHDERAKQFSGKWFTTSLYYSNNLSTEPYKSKEEFERLWNK